MHLGVSAHLMPETKISVDCVPGASKPLVRFGDIYPQVGIWASTDQLKQLRDAIDAYLAATQAEAA